jgi:hypothetical protein
MRVGFFRIGLSGNTCPPLVEAGDFPIAIPGQEEEQHNPCEQESQDAGDFHHGSLSWGQPDSNRQPSGYEPPALTVELCPRWHARFFNRRGRVTMPAIGRPASPEAEKGAGGGSPTPARDSTPHWLKDDGNKHARRQTRKWKIETIPSQTLNGSRGGRGRPAPEGRGSAAAPSRWMEIRRLRRSSRRERVGRAGRSTRARA